MILIRKDLNYAIHQIVLSKLIFAVDNLQKPISMQFESKSDKVSQAENQKKIESHLKF